jgi:glycosyltransferase involved in cell wall biosynthesis
VIDMPEAGADPDLFASTDGRRWDGPLTFLFVGRLVPFKCPDVAVSAFADSPALRGHRLELIGDGPERPALERLIAEKNLGDRVSLSGWLSQTEVARRMQSAHAFAFPSIRDAGAGAMVEAMASGLAPIAVDYGPFRQMLTDDCSLKIPLGDRAAHVAGYRAAMERLAGDPALCRTLGERARRRALDLFSWQARARKIVQAYEWALSRRATKPNAYVGDEEGAR